MYNSLYKFYRTSLISLVLILLFQNFLTADNIPSESDFSKQGTLKQASGIWGQWDYRLDGAISPCSCVKFNDTYYFYYIAADSNRSDDGGPAGRSLAVMTSVDGITWTDYASNPIYSFAPNYDQEEGVFSCAALADGDSILLYLGLMFGSGGSVSASTYLFKSPDGYKLYYVDVVLEYSDNNVAGWGDEVYPLGVYKNGSEYNLFYTASGFNLYLARLGSDPSSYNSTKELNGYSGEGGGNPVWLNNDSLAICFVRSYWTRQNMYKFHKDSPDQLGSSVEDYSFTEGSCPLGMHTMYLDRSPSVKKWFFFLNGDEGQICDGAIELWTAPWTSIYDTTPPSQPTDLNAVPISENQINLSWNFSNDPESGISHYIIYRDGIFAKQSSDTSYSDIGLNENTLYTYEVSAVNGDGLESEKSDPSSATTLPDLVAPTIISILTNGDRTQVKVVYSEPMEESSVTHMANYSIDNGIIISSTSLSSDLKTVTLTTSPHSVGITYTLTVNNVYDRASIPNVILPNTQISYYYSPKLIVSNLTVSSGKNYVVIDSLNDGAAAYIDRTYTYSNLPDFLLDKVYIRTANDDKFSQESQFLSFEVNQSVKVYVAHDDLYEIKPDWLGNFTDTGENLVIDGSPMSVFERSYSGGTVTLGGNVHPSQSDNNNMYTVIIEGSGLVTTSHSEPIRPHSFLLSQNYPNPFNSSTKISYQLASKSNVVLEIFDNLGKIIQTVVDTTQSAGIYEVQIDGQNLPSGIYLYRLRAGNFTKIRKMLLLR